MSIHLAIREYERVYVDDDVRTGELIGGRRMIARKHFRRLRRFDERNADTEGELLFDWRRRWFRPRNLVGVVQLGALSVEILPKIAEQYAEAHRGDEDQGVQFARANLLYMLGMAGEVPFRERDVAAQSLRKAPLSETLIALFADRLMRQLVRGPHHAYVEQRDNLNVMRGKLLFSRHIKHNAARRDRFFVERDEFVADTLLNRIFKATCRHLLESTRAPATEEKLNYCLMVLDEVDDRPVHLEQFDRIVEDRRNERFADALSFCRMIWEQQAPTARVGRFKTFTLLFDMNAVFEKFIAAFLRRYVISGDQFPNTRVRPQSRGLQRHLLRRFPDRTTGEMRLKPDIVIEGLESVGTLNKSERVVIDTKWKQLDTDGSWRQGVRGSDLYQLFAYAHRFNADHSILLYPWLQGCQPRQMLVPDGRQQFVHIRFVGLNHDLGTRSGRQRLREELRGLLGEMQSLDNGDAST